MEPLIKLRASYRGNFTKFHKKVTVELGTDVDNSSLYEVWLIQLVEKYGKIQEVDKAILEILQVDETCSQEQIDKETESVEEYQDSFICLKIKLEKLEKQSVSNLEAKSKRKFKLPEIELKQFGGDIKDWLAFWGQFKKIDEDLELANEDKFQYLIQSTEKGSRAREVVDSFPPTAQNYSLAVDCLKSRFGKEDILVEVYVRELLSLVMSNAVGQNRLPLVKLYDRVETQLRALEMLGVTSDKYASMLYPLVESCLPSELLRIWERNLGSLTLQKQQGEEFNKLEKLMSFLRSEIEGEEKINLAKNGFNVDMQKKKNLCPRDKGHPRNVPSGIELFSSSQKRNFGKMTCIFCSKPHASLECRTVKNLTVEERKQAMEKSNVCFKCLKPNHRANRCTSRIRCLICQGWHNFLLCQRNVNNNGQKEAEATPQNASTSSCSESLANFSTTTSVMLQTLKVKIIGTSEVIVRAVIDTGSQRSYILDSTAKRLGLHSQKVESLQHELFGGSHTQVVNHNVYQTFMESVVGDYRCNAFLLGQQKICSALPPVGKGTWVSEIKNQGIHVTDYGKGGPIEILFGADIAGKLMTGGYKRLSGDISAIHTKLGWTLIGKTSLKDVDMSTCLFAGNVQMLWDLDVIGITDPAQSQSKEEISRATEEHFLNTVTRDIDGRYEVSLPWLEGHQPPQNNKFLAEKRLKNTIKSLKEKKILEKYEEVFNEWLEEEVIEPVDLVNLDNEDCHFLPHRAVIKEESTTRIRPVFDASSREKNRLSLNDCLEKGPNQVELIPKLLNRFRLGKFGTIADIRRAFLQVGVKEIDRNYLQFLWWEGGESEKLKIFRHKRLVFGVNSSPFLLGATINYHLDNVEHTKKDIAEVLKHSMYVDNCVTSFDSEEELLKFIAQAKEIMASAKFDLRGWQHNGSSQDENSVSVAPVLGLKWNLEEDTLYCDAKCNILDLPVTKRKILSGANQVFDPIGFLSPVTLTPKLLMQECWREKVSWDATLSDELSKKYIKWKNDLNKLAEVKIPRHVATISGTAEENVSLHVFCDASKVAYATCIYLRVENENGEVTCQLIQSKSRIVPLKPITIPRLELLACLIGTRLVKTIKEDSWFEKQTFYWTDSMDALYWIKNDEPWGLFVANRVQEIRSSSQREEWNHVPGFLNPADLPSRGCSMDLLLRKRWWEGPQWLYMKQEDWPHTSELHDETTVNSEKRKMVVTSVNNTTEASNWYYGYFSTFKKTVRMISWILRFISNSRTPNKCLSQALSSQEIEKAELTLARLVQQDSFLGPTDTSIKALKPLVDKEGVIRAPTRIINRQDSDNFRYPIIMPGDHPVVQRLIIQRHKEMLHCGIQTLMADLRETYWIVKGRKSIRKALSSCVICKRFSSKNPDLPLPPLPEDRIRDAMVFEVTGVDLAGPLYLKDGTKCWIVLFTCAVYRTLHLELATSLSTCAFLLALRRFIARRGRPQIIYSDNGSNFTGANNALRQIDWSEIMKEDDIQKISWKFIPPASPWWGGWWERLVGLVKGLLRRVLGRACLRYEELYTTLCECENVINCRPLTYISEDLELDALTPAMFLRDLKEGGVPDLDNIDSVYHRKRLAYCVKLKKDLRARFRTEYLGQLRQDNKKTIRDLKIEVGDVVLISNDNKRLNWPLGKILEVYPSKDGIVRVVKVKTKTGELLRPIQKIFPLEVHSTVAGETLRNSGQLTQAKKKEKASLTQEPAGPGKEPTQNELVRQPEEKPVTTSRGRVVRAPIRMDL